MNFQKYRLEKRNLFTRASNLKLRKALSKIAVTGLIISLFNPFNLKLALAKNAEASDFSDHNKYNVEYTSNENEERRFNDSGYYYYADTGVKVNNNIGYTAGEGLPFYKDTLKLVEGREIVLIDGHYCYADTGYKVDGSIEYAIGETLPRYKDTHAPVNDREVVFGPTNGIPFYLDTGAKVEGNIDYTAAEGLPFYKDTMTDINDRKVVLIDGYYYYADTLYPVEDSIMYGAGDALPYYKDTLQPVKGRTIGIHYTNETFIQHANGTDEIIRPTEEIVLRK